MRLWILVVLLATVAVGQVLTDPVAGDIDTEPSKAHKASDGGVEYGKKTKKADGGVAHRKATADCVRRKAGAAVASCRHKTLGDIGDLNRMYAADSQGGQCQPVACSVYLGQNADLEEQEMLYGKDGG